MSASCNKGRSYNIIVDRVINTEESRMDMKKKTRKKNQNIVLNVDAKMLDYIIGFLKRIKTERKPTFLILAFGCVMNAERFLVE